MEADVMNLLILFLIAPFIFILPIIIGMIIWRRKYYDKKTGWKKCGVCGSVVSPIFYEEGILGRKYHCR
jgi:uncharacterized membrane protein YhfC